MSLEESGYYHVDSYEKWQSLRSRFPRPTNLFFESYPPGSWEFAVMCVVEDAGYELALQLLVYAMDMQKVQDVCALLLRLQYSIGCVCTHLTASARPLVRGCVVARRDMGSYFAQYVLTQPFPSICVFVSQSQFAGESISSRFRRPGVLSSARCA